MIPVVVISGFLGSGKTTVLNRLLANPAMRNSAVVVNEIGEIGIDHDLILEADEDTLLLSGGCLCCAMRGSMVDTLTRLLQSRRAPVERIFLETTGAADPVPVLAALATAPELAGKAAVRLLVTVVDAVLAPPTLDRHEEARRQVALADQLLLTKTDIADGAAQAEATRRARELNPLAPLYVVARGAFTNDFVRSLSDTSDDTPEIRRRERIGQFAASEAQHSGGGFITAAVQFPGTLPQDSVEQWLDDLLSCFGGHILRVKGLLDIAGHDGPVVLQGVQHIVSAPQILPDWPGSNRNSRIVIIAQGIDAALLDESLAWLAAQAQGLAKLTDQRKRSR